MYSHISPREELIRQAKELRKAVYNADETMPNKMPKKREASGLLEEQLEYTKELYAERYKIEAKNAELKNNYNYDQANAWGKLGITIQGATTLFLANMKRIYRLEEEKRLNNIK